MEAAGQLPGRWDAIETTPTPSFQERTHGSKGCAQLAIKCRSVLIWLPAGQLAAPVPYLPLHTDNRLRTGLLALEASQHRNLVCVHQDLLCLGFFFFYFQRDSLNFTVLFLYFSGLQCWAPTLSHPLCLVRLFLSHVVPGGERSMGAKPCVGALAGSSRFANPM